MKKIAIFFTFILALLLSGSAQDLFSAEKVAVTEEELAEEVQIIEDEAGATPDSPLYVVDIIIEDINLRLKSGEEKAEYALAVKEEKLAEAAVMIGTNQSAEAQEALSRANNLSGIIVTEVGLNLGEEATERAQLSEEFLAKLKKGLPSEEEWTEVKGLLESQLSQEEKIKIASELAEKIGSYCDNLAQQDFEMMIKDVYCNPEKAPEWLKEYIAEDLQARQDQAEEMMVEMLTTCINDPRECDCSQIPVQSEQRKCQENTELAVRCEFGNDLDACKELEQKPIEAPEGMPDFLKPIFESTIRDLIQEKERTMFARFAPPECVEAGLDNREDCEELMMEKYMPPECKEAGATSKEECEEIMMEKYGAPPEECMKDGRPISREECEAIMIEKHDIPNECIEDGHPIGKEECEKIMIEKYIPPECKEAGATSKEECEKIMKEKMPGEGMPPEGIAGPPPECTENGEFIGEEECQKIIEEKYGGMMPPGEGIPSEECPPVCAIVCEYGHQLDEKGCPTCSCNPAPGEKKDFIEEKWPGYEAIPIREDLVLIRNPQTGESETVTREQAREWVEENLGSALPPPEQGEELEQLLEEIEELERQREEPFLPPGEEASEDGGPEETWQLPQEGPNLPNEEEPGLPPSEETSEEPIAEEPVSEPVEEESESSEESSSTEEGSSGSEGESSEPEG